MNHQYFRLAQTACEPTNIRENYTCELIVEFTNILFSGSGLLISSSSVQQPDPNMPKAEGAQMVAMRGEQLGVVTNWPPSLEAALQRWGTISPKAPCLTTMDTNGKPLYVLTYGT